METIARDDGIGATHLVHADSIKIENGAFTSVLIALAGHPAYIPLPQGRGCSRTFRQGVRGIRYISASSHVHLFPLDEGDGLASDALTAAGEAQTVGGLGFHADALKGQAKELGESGAHGRHLRRETRALGNDGRVYVADAPAALLEQVPRVAKESRAWRIAPACIAGGKVQADV